MTCVHLVDLNCPSCGTALSLFGDLFLIEDELTNNNVTSLTIDKGLIINK
jgi:hypothetical protein